MPGPQPATTAAEVLTRLQALMRSPDTSSFEWKRVEKDARALIATDPAAGFSALGASMAGQFKIDEMHDAYREALHHRGVAFFTHANYSVTLLYAGLFDESIEQNRRAIELDGGRDLSLYLRSFEMARTLGRYEEAIRYLKEVPKHLCEDWEREFAACNLALEIAAQRGLAPSTVSEMTLAATAFLREHRVHYVEGYLEIDPYARFIVSVLEVATTLEQASELNARLADTLSAFDGWYAEGFSLQLDAFEDEHQSTATA